MRGGCSASTAATSNNGRQVTDNEARGRSHALARYSTERRLDVVLGRLTGALAIAGGMLMTGVVAMTGVSVVGRHLFNAPIPGDYEITELACGVAVFAFFPYCHMKNGNIVVEFFTERMRPRYKTALDTAHNFVFAVVAALISWRLFVGGVHKFEDGETTLFLGIPIWLGYFSALPGAVLLTAVCVWMFHRHLGVLCR